MPSTRQPKRSLATMLPPPRPQPESMTRGVGAEPAEVVGEELGLGVLQAVQLAHQPLLAALLGAVQDGPVGGADAVVVVVEPVDLAQA